MALEWPVQALTLARLAGRGPNVRPTLDTDERHEAHGQDAFHPVVAIVAADHAHQCLSATGIGHRHHQPAARPELGAQGWGDAWRLGCGDDGVVGCAWPPAQAAVALYHFDASIAQPPQRLAGASGERRDALDRVNCTRDVGQDGGVVAGACSDFQDVLVTPQAQCLRHGGDDVGL